MFSMIGYFVALYSLAASASSALGLTQKEASTLQSISAAGQLIGRPLCGSMLDLIGRHPCTIIIQVLAGFTCFTFWFPARSFGLLVVFTITQGLLGGTVWSSAAPISAEVVGIRDLPKRFGGILIGDGGSRTVWTTDCCGADQSQSEQFGEERSQYVSHLNWVLRRLFYRESYDAMFKLEICSKDK
ncbi:uncharacterized protein MEPE_00114 [Melanopsichium pennsylvanicum]|uniref:Major facilitator superfamily (MFS) profile domain-containing protein n=1 Tax=Melanopsichium pennsylvanicum TaxID=63383 RepID=A0AAJ4XFG6_9BASI|nr:uncharacterized protein MEPE_00114 [Melanopsichium pennsylvanicum]